jgi:DNA-binding transcriptional LysR family regulator
MRIRMTVSPDWDLLQSLHAVLEAGSFSAAAKLRRLTQPTLGRHIDQLERQLGSPLFLRSPRGLQPTDLALSFRPHLADMAAAASAAARDASDAAGGETGIVRLTVSDNIGVEVMPPIMAGFREAHPGVEVELVLSNRNEDLTRRAADIAVRMARPTQNSLVAKKVGVLELGFHATPEYLARNGTPKSLADLASHALIGRDRDQPNADVIPGLAAAGIVFGRELFSLRTDNDVAQLAMIRSGYGIGVCQTQIGRRYGFQRVLPDEFKMILEMWVCMHETLRGSPRMRLMFDHLTTALEAYAADV